MRLTEFFPFVFILMLSWHLLPSSAQCTYNTTTCISVNVSSCLGAKITFQRTTLMFANDSTSIDETETNLAQWQLLRGVPECWAVVQPFLCSVYLPKCDDTLDQVELPNKELCDRTREPCKVVPEYNNGQWPEFLQCDQWFYGENCGSTYYQEAVFNTSSTCNSPLIRTTDSSSWYEEIKGCGIPCQNPLFTSDEHNAVHIFIAVFGSLCIASTVFTLLTFVIDWKSARRYPAVILFFINGCFFLGSIGWMAQFAGNARQDITCRSDGTARKSEPQVGSSETASCTIVFVLVYYFMMAGVTWFVMLAYSWDITFKALGTVRDDLSKKTAYFHIISWCLPLVLTIVCLAISEVDGDSLSGICFVGYYEKGIRAGFVLAPVGVVLVVGLVFLIRGLHTLIKVKKDSPQFVSDKATAKIRGTILRLGIFTGLAFGFVFTTFSVHLYTFTNESKWADSFKDYIYCQANVSVTLAANQTSNKSCDIGNRPSVAAAIIHVFAFFGAGIAMSSWSWTKASLEAWERFLRRVFNKPSNKPQKVKKHRIIAKAFNKRKEINNGRLSISFGSSHDDPLGMKFDLNSMSSHSVSSSFAAAMPKLVRRRGGMMHPVAGTLRRYSDSDISSIASRMTKTESRRQSYESSMSQKLNDLEQDLEEARRKKRKRKKRRKRNTIQPVLEPISSAMAALHGGRRKKIGGHRRRCSSDSSNLSKASAHSIRLAMDKRSLENMSLSSNILSDSVTTNGSISEIFLPQPKNTNFSMFTASTMLPQQQESKGENSSSLKNPTPSPQGSFRRGRRREVKLEVTETSFYQEDSDNVEMGGNQTAQGQGSYQEAGEMTVALPGDKKANIGETTLRFGSAGSQGPKRFGSASSNRSFTKGPPVAPDSRKPVPAHGNKGWTGNYLISSDNPRIGSASSRVSRGSAARAGSAGSQTQNYNNNKGRIGSGNSNASWSRYAQPDVASNPQQPERRFQLKRRHGSGSAGSRSSRSSRSSSSRSQVYLGDGKVDSGTSRSSRGSRSLRHDGIKVDSATSSSSRYSRYQESTILPGVEGEVNILNLEDLIDYDDDDYDDDDTLTEVSSLR